MPTATILPQLSPRDYLLGERDGTQRHEYLNGEVVAMSGGSRAHNLLATRVARLLGNHLEGGPCRIYQSDMKVRIKAANRFYYPDVMVCCGPVDAEPDLYYETAPQLIVEVLSPSTAANDDGEKRINYQTRASLDEYLLLDPTTAAATLYRRGSSFWTRIQLDRHDQLELASIGLNGAMQWLLGEPAATAR
ncbi:Uma2 family endonuclease [uncultured Thiodictyon sp.]|uniref:Uma2 family endonuclease n=1 Tax=uncultured Thiodictyon sp. TaxID=1846217 RepID=UPI0025E1E88B|nr:Uma2 family endonuclease [uncultured Thiodictyon sp.]